MSEPHWKKRRREAMELQKLSRASTIWPRARVFGGIKDCSGVSVRWTVNVLFLPVKVLEGDYKISSDLQ
jgi:hypothetical protein